MSLPSPLSPQAQLGFRCWHGPGRRMAAAHTHLEIEANFIGRGAIAYLFGGRRVDVAEGEWAIFWGSVPHQLIFLDEQSEISWFTVPLSRFLDWRLPPVLTQGLLCGQILTQAAEEARDALNFAIWERDLNSGDVARTSVVALEMEARLRRLALDLGSETRSHSGTTNGEIGHIERMAAFMAQNYADPIRTDDVAKSAGLHPNYAMNLFKRGFGLSIGEFLVRTRLSQVQRLLVTTDRNVLDIAFCCGFGSASQFYAAFKKSCGESPADYRRSLLR